VFIGISRGGREKFIFHLLPIGKRRGNREFEGTKVLVYRD
jgi:hypothetical protein